MPVDRSREKFILLAEARVTKAIKALRLVGNLSNKSNYKYTDEDAKKIIKALEGELKQLKSRFESYENSNGVTFKL